MSNRRKRRKPEYGKPVSSHDKPSFNPRLIAAKRRGRIIILDPVEPEVEPPYCTHGKVSCYACGDWCWLGCESYEYVATGEAAGLCLPCAIKYIPAGTPTVGRVEDTLHHE